MSKLDVLREKDSFKKYKKMQENLVKSKSDLQRLKEELQKFEKLNEKSGNLEILRKNRDEKAEKIKKEVEKGNNTLKNIRSFFRELAGHVLSTNALLYTNTNNEGNIEFFVHYTTDEDPTSPTSEGEGTTYHKFLCVFFDLSVLRFYKDSHFYHFVYHDGIMEGLDDRKKLSLIEILRGIHEKIQYTIHTHSY